MFSLVSPSRFLYAHLMNTALKGVPQRPQPGIYVSVLDNCPACKGKATSNILLPSTNGGVSGVCQVCGGSGMIMGLMPFDQALLVVLDALGLLSEEEKGKVAERLRQASLQVQTLSEP